ncbi:hypothetical protein ACEQ8H_003732 [Pleosporales sp. CAS-2024a]
MSRRNKLRSRTPSPVKKPPHSATFEYRHTTMQLANVFVESEPEMPADVAALVQQILQDREEDAALDALITTLAQTYTTDSRHLAGKCAGEGEWRVCTQLGLINHLNKYLSPMLSVSACEKPWNRFLKPVAARLLVPPIFPPPELPTLTAFTTPTTTRSQNDRSSSAASVTASDFTEDDPLQLSTPKPDITVGLASNAIQKALNLPYDVLLWLQSHPDNPTPFVSDPHQVPVGLRFPVLVVESKGMNTGANLIHAQNQAAVSAASALNILCELDARAAPKSRSNDEVDQPAIVFSIATEGPTHEIWVHYKVADKYHMACLQSCRTTLSGHTETFVRSLAQIMRWAATEFQTKIVKKVDQLWMGLLADSVEEQARLG